MFGAIGLYRRDTITILALLLLFSVHCWPATATASSDVDGGAGLPIPNDALIPPDADLSAVSLKRLGNEPGAAVPGYYQTSEYMIGHVAVGLILPESDGSHEAESEDWTDQEIAKVTAKVHGALEWWASLEPAAHLTFTVESRVRVPIGYEPINHALPEQGLWIGETMTALGFESDLYFSAVRDYVNDLRDRTHSDWAFAIFVVDSSADLDGRLADDYFAYAFLGGPLMVMTFDNSGYGIGNMDAVAAHEIGHIFNALDQYATSQARCDRRAGYLNVENGNSLVSGPCASDETSIMRGGIYPYREHAIDYFARGQIGWWDSNGDGVLDPVDAPPAIRIQRNVTEVKLGDVLSFNGRAWQEPVSSPTRADATISRIERVEALVDGATPYTAIPRDGQFDGLVEHFDLEVGPLETGLHTLEIRAVNSEGMTSTAPITTAFVFDPVDGALTSRLTGNPEQILEDLPAQFHGVATSAYGDAGPKTPSVASVQFSVDGGAWEEALADDGQFDSPLERFVITLNNLRDGEHVLTLQAIDSEGKVETNLQTFLFRVETESAIFIPIVAK